jgi:hypothetical protein
MEYMDCWPWAVFTRTLISTTGEGSVPLPYHTFADSFGGLEGRRRRRKIRHARRILSIEYGRGCGCRQTLAQLASCKSSSNPCQCGNGSIQEALNLSCFGGLDSLERQRTESIII